MSMVPLDALVCPACGGYLKDSGVEGFEMANNRAEFRDFICPHCGWQIVIYCQKRD